MHQSPKPPVIHSLCTIITLAVLGLGSAACIEADEIDGFDEPAEGQPDKEQSIKKPKPAKPVCIDDDQCSDGVGDTTLNYAMQNIDFPDAMFRVGKKVRLFGREYPCNDSPCATSWAVVRDLRSGKLTTAHFGKPTPDAQTLSNYGETPETWLWPLTIDPGDHGNCQPYDSGCGDDTVLQRGAIDYIGPGGEHARVLDGTSGWAPAGYYSNVIDWTLGDASCQYALWSGRANVIRTDCDGACPAPDFAEGCGPTAGPHDDFWISFFGEEGDPGGSFDGICRVLAVVGQKVSLDCIYSDSPF